MTLLVLAATVVALVTLAGRKARVRLKPSISASSAQDSSASATSEGDPTMKGALAPRGPHL